LNSVVSEGPHEDEGAPWPLEWRRLKKKAKGKGLYRKDNMGKEY